MTDKPTPTDAELKAMWQIHAADIGGIFSYARAVLAKWGTPAPVGVGEVAEHYRNAIASACEGWTMPDGLRKHLETALWSPPTPQPTQPQAGAVPLTCEWTHNEDDGFWETACGEAWRFDDGGPGENNMHFCHSCGNSLRIKGGKHGDATPQPTQPVAREQLTEEQIQDLLLCGNPTDEEMRLIRIGWDAARGIKGGQHGAE